MLPKELKEILHTEFVKYFERKSQKPRRKRQRKNKLCADNYKIKRMIFKKDLEYNYYWQNHDNPSNGQCRQLKIYQKYKIKMSKST
mgnify:CR=1 FL=1